MNITLTPHVVAEPLMGWRPIGKVEGVPGTITSGVLVENASGTIWAMQVGNLLYNLDQRAVRLRVNPPARKNKISVETRTRLDKDLVDYARSLGNGNVSEGIRRALAYCKGVNHE